MKSNKLTNRLTAILVVACLAFVLAAITTPTSTAGNSVNWAALSADSNPLTADDSNILLWVCIMVAAAAALIIALVVRSKKKKNALPEAEEQQAITGEEPELLETPDEIEPVDEPHEHDEEEGEDDEHIAR
jgi:beta-lactamase regulating signal transducer with metallopeptidase domain